MTVRPWERDAGGLWCHEVLELLGDFADGDLDAEAAAAVGAHVGECDGCARFGDAYARTLLAIRSVPPAVPSVLAALRDKLD